MSKKPTHSRSAPTPYANFLYLLAELEKSVDLGNIQWPTDAGDAILARLGRIAQKVALEFGGHRPGKIH